MSNQQANSPFMDAQRAEAKAYRRAVMFILALISTLALGQGLYAYAISDRFLLKDAADWGYDVVLWALTLIVFGRGAQLERLAALAVAGIMLLAAAHTGYDLWDKIITARRPEIWVAGWSALSASSIAIILLFVMFRFRKADNPLIAATWLSSRNTAINTIAYAIVGLGARLSPQQWPEIALDLFIIGLSLQAAYAIIRKVNEGNYHV